VSSIILVSMAKDDAKSTAPAKAKSRAPAKAKSFSKGKPFNKKTKPTTPVKPEKNESKTVTDAKGLWNKLRGEAEKEKIVALTDSLYELVSEQILALAKKHDTSRIIQCLIGHASPPQFSHILTTLKPALKDLATSQYSHFIVLKLIKKGERSGAAAKCEVRSEMKNVNIFNSFYDESSFVLFHYSTTKLNN